MESFFLGAAIVAISVIVAYMGGQYYEGAISLHKVSNPRLSLAFLSQILSLITLVAPVYIAGCAFSKGVRFQDVLGTLTLARYPLLLMAFFGFFISEADIIEITNSILAGDLATNVGGLVTLSVITLVSIIAVVWSIALYYNAFRVSTDIRGGKGIAIFIACMLFAEIAGSIIAYAIRTLF